MHYVGQLRQQAMISSGHASAIRGIAISDLVLCRRRLCLGKPGDCPWFSTYDPVVVQLASNPFRCETPRTFRQCGQKYTSRLLRNEDDSACAPTRSNSFSQYGQIGRTSPRSSTGIPFIENSPYILSLKSGVAARLRRRTRTTQKN